MEIKVIGHHAVEVAADKAVVGFSVGYGGRDREAVMEQTAAAAAAAKDDLTRLKDAGAVSSFTLESISTWATFPDRKTWDRREERFKAQVSGSATFVEFAELGRFVAIAGTHASWQLQGVQWGLSRAVREAIEPDVLGKAFANAQQRALWLAVAAERNLLAPIEISDQVDGPPMARFAMPVAYGAASDSSATIELVPGTIEVVGRVQVTFEAS